MQDKGVFPLDRGKSKGARLDKRKLQAGFSLVFAAGQRPSADDIERLFSATETARTGACISHRPGEGEGPLELLASGLTFDLEGLAPAAPVLPVAPRHRFGIDAELPESAIEAVGLVPGHHISGGHAAMPVVKAMAGLAANLALHLNARAICWHPAATWMDPNYFARLVLNWQSGGAFPALGLTAVEEGADGGVLSHGLEFFAGQELQVQGKAGEAPAETVKLAVRVIDHVVRHGPLQAPRELEGPSGEMLVLEPSRFGKLILVWRGA